MELDKRIKEGKRPLTCLDVEQAREFEGKQCLFSDSYVNYKNIREYAKYPQYTGVLHIGEDKQILRSKEDYVFRNLTDGYLYSLVLPLEWVKPEEPKDPEEIYRAFSLNEFSELYAIGDVVTFRLKDCEVVEQSMLIGFQSIDDEDTPGNGYVLIGNCRYGFMELFNNYELKHLNHWQPFGILDE